MFHLQHADLGLCCVLRLQRRKLHGQLPDLGARRDLSARLSELLAELVDLRVRLVQLLLQHYLDVAAARAG